MTTEPFVAPILRWACNCGRFIAQSAIRETTVVDPGRYYGVRTDTEYDCSRCGVVEDAPRLVQVGEEIVLVEMAEVP